MKAKTPKSTKATAEQRKTRSLAAYKAHITRQKQILAASRSAPVKAEARKALKAITANMNAFEQPKRKSHRPNAEQFGRRLLAMRNAAKANGAGEHATEAAG
jgi:hypothetical protein